MRKILGEYKSDVRIDDNNLEEEWMHQPSLFMYYAEAHSDALYERDLAKSKAEYKYATMYSDIKKNWEKYFDSKPTEPAIKEYIIAHPAYRKVEKIYLEACRNANTMLAAKTAFDHRKRALENLVSLKISGFYSEPRNKVKDFKNKGGHKERQQALNKDKTESRVTSRKPNRKRRRKK